MTLEEALQDKRITTLISDIESNKGRNPYHLSCKWQSLYDDKEMLIIIFYCEPIDLNPLARELHHPRCNAFRSAQQMRLAPLAKV